VWVVCLQPPTTSFFQALAATASLRSVRWLLQHADNRQADSDIGATNMPSCLSWTFTTYKTLPLTCCTELLLCTFAAGAG
jgi:hypothetical protein